MDQDLHHLNQKIKPVVKEGKGGKKKKTVVLAEIA